MNEYEWNNGNCRSCIHVDKSLSEKVCRDCCNGKYDNFVLSEESKRVRR